MIATTHYKALLKLGIPIVIGQLGMIVLGFADTLMIGHHSTEDLAAASFVNNMFNLVIIFATGFSYGLTPIVGSLFGSGKKKAVGQTLKNALWANGLMGILLSALMGILYLNIFQITNITLFFKDIMFIYKKRGYETISPFSEETNYALFSLILAFFPVSPLR